MVKYPKGINKTSDLTKKTNKNIIYGSRGMSLEEKLNQSNIYYRQRKLAVIHKKPTPIQVVKVDYPKRSAAQITEAYYKNASTTDYNGIYLGQYIDFEAKETNNKTSFPLSNLPSHQIEHMKECHNQGGIVFVIISFNFYGEIYVLPFEELNLFLLNNDRRSIQYSYIKKKGILCPTGYSPMIDYLKAIDIYLEKNNL